MSAARALVERAAHGSSEHTYGVNTGFGRFVSKQIPEELTEELQVRLLRSPRVRRRRAVPRRGRARRDAASRERACERQFGCPDRDRRVAARVPRTRGSPTGACTRLGRCVGRSRATRASGAAARRRGRGLARGRAARPAATRLRRAGLEPVRLAAKEGLSLINGTQFMAAQGALGLVRAAGSRGQPTARALSRSRRCRVRAPRSCRRCTLSGRCAGRAPRHGTCSACSTARRSSSRIAGATRCRTPTRSGVRRRCMEPRGTCSTTSSTPSERS